MAFTTQGYNIMKGYLDDPAATGEAIDRGELLAPCSAESSAPTDPACKGAYFNGQPINGAVQGGNLRGLVATLAFSD